MKYFVSIENSPYFHWQTELLIESFKMHNLQDDLIIYIADYLRHFPEEHCRNLIDHKNKFFHDNFGGAANRIYSLYMAVGDNILEEKFCVMHSDMILKNPITNYISSHVVCNSVADLHPDVEEYVFRKFSNNYYFDMPIIFNYLTKQNKEDFFATLANNFKKILSEKGNDFPCEKTAWKITLIELYKSMNYSFSMFPMTCNLLDKNLNVPFVHYNHGLPPGFNKRLFKYCSNPYDELINYNPTESSDYFNKVIKSYLGLT